MKWRGTFPLQDNNGDGIRASGVGCLYSGAQDGMGDYRAQWTVDGTVYGPLFYTAPLLGPNTTEGCIFVNDNLPAARAGGPLRRWLSESSGRRGSNPY